MKRINSFDELSRRISAYWKRGMVANASVSAEVYKKEIDAGTMYAAELSGALLLLRRRENLDRMNFYLLPGADPRGWKPERTTVMEIPVRPKDAALKQTEQLWREVGFRQRDTRQRIVLGEENALAAMRPSYPVREAEEGDLGAIRRMMELAYDPQTACIPTDDELRGDIRGGNVLSAVSPEGEVVGFLHMIRGERVTEYRHLVVLPEMRRRGIAQSLFAFDYHRGGPRKFMLWVAVDNTPALKLYEKLGYENDVWTSTVWTYDM